MTKVAGTLQDSAQVLVMSTIHNLQTGTARLRRRPKENRLNAKLARAAFGDEVRKLLTILDDYNHQIGGVDIADQLSTGLL